MTATTELFERSTPNYSATTLPEPRPFEDGAHQALRDGMRGGHQCQMLMSRTANSKCQGRDEPTPMFEAMPANMMRELVSGHDEALLPEHALEQVKIVEAGERKGLEMWAGVMGRRNG